MSKKQKRAALTMKIEDPDNVNQIGLDRFLSLAKRDNKTVVVHSDLKNSINQHNMETYRSIIRFQKIVNVQEGGYFVVVADSNGKPKNQQTLDPYQNL